MLCIITLHNCDKHSEHTYSDLNTMMITQAWFIYTYTLVTLQEQSHVNRELLVLFSGIVRNRIFVVTPLSRSYRCPWHRHCHDGQHRTHNVENVGPSYCAPSQTVYVRPADHDNSRRWKPHRKEEDRCNQRNNCIREEEMRDRHSHHTTGVWNDTYSTLSVNCPNRISQSVVKGCNNLVPSTPMLLLCNTRS